MFEVFSKLIKLFRRIWVAVMMRRMLSVEGQMLEEVEGRISYFMRSVSRHEGRVVHTFVLTDLSLLILAYESGRVKVMRSIKGGINSDAYEEMHEHAKNNMSLRVK
jgi:hypothetical protein